MAQIGQTTVEGIIAVTAEEYERVNKGSVSMLRIMRQAGPVGVKTRVLAEQSIGSRNSKCYLHWLLDKLEKDSMVSRFKEPRMSNGKRHRGKPAMMNMILPRGIELIKQVDG